MKFDIDEKEEKKLKKRNEDKQKLNMILVFFFVIGFIILIIVLVATSGSKKQQAAPIETPKPITSPQPINPVDQKSLTVYNEESAERPIAVMIDNAIGDAKHAGLQDSYLNYEILVEGGLTRIMAIYKDKDVALIGPVRSSRHYFLDYMLESDAIYVHYGWSPYAEEDEKSLGINNINGIVDQEVFRRDSNAVAPHNVFTKMSYIRSFLDKTSYSVYSDNYQLLNYSVDRVDLERDTGYVAKEANEVVIPYSSTDVRTYKYDATNEFYLRSQNGKPQLDRRTNRQLHYKNIIIQRVDYEVVDSEGRLDVKTVGSGKGYIITNGHFLPMTWTKSARNAKTVYTYEDGSEVIVNDGNTFIQIVPTNSSISIG